MKNPVIAITVWKVSSREAIPNSRTVDTCINEGWCSSIAGYLIVIIKGK